MPLSPLSNKPRKIITASLAAAAILAAFVTGFPIGPATAQTAGTVMPQGAARLQVDSLQAQAYAVQQEMQGLNRELEIVVERHNATRLEFDRLTLQLADSRARLDAALADQNAQEELLNSRLRAVYKASDVNFMSVLLNSKSLTDFYEQSRYIARISEQDIKLEQQFKERADQISYLTDEIDHQRLQQMGLEEDLAEQKLLIETKISERQSRLDQIDAQVKQVLAKEAERQRAEQDRIAAEQRALLSQLEINNGIQAQVVQTALQYLGVNYVWGGESPAGFDCSGLTKFVFAQHGVDLPHYAASQFKMGVPVPPDQLLPGDLLFWGPGEPHHVAMFIGQGKYIEAPTFGEVVKISELKIDDDYAGARRFPLKARS